MSQENVDFLRSFFAGARELDRDALIAALPDLIAAGCDPAIEWIEDPNRADGRVYRGHAGVRESWERWLENFAQWRFEVESITEHGDRVLAVARQHARGGKVLRYEEFYDERDARAALTP